MSKFLYLMQNEIGRYKIGISDNPENRMKTLQSSGGLLVELVKTWRINHASKLEELLHAKYNHHWYLGEWFDIPYCPMEEISNIIDEYYKTSSSADTWQEESEWYRFFFSRFVPEGQYSHKRSSRSFRY